MSINNVNTTKIVLLFQVIVVIPSYRLDIFGFFTTQDGHAPGNWGLLDQVAALDWVKNQIKEFGGQPDRIIIAGHSAGAISVGFHIVSSLSVDYFVGAIGMSGSAFTPGVIKTQQQDGISRVSYTFSCNKDSPSLLTCLRRTNADVLLRESAKISSWGPIVDADYVNSSVLPFFAGDPFTLFQNSRFNKVPLMIGYTDMEDALSFTEKNFNKDDFKNIITDSITDEIPEPKDNDTCSVRKEFLIDSILFFYTPSAPLTEDMTVLRQKYIDFTNEKRYGSGVVLQASFMSKIKPVYLYRFDYRLKTLGICDLEDWMNVPQMCELPFVWGMPYWTSLSSQVVWNIADKKVADSVMSMWGNFTKFFNPSQSGRSIRWEQFSTDSPGILILDKNFNMSDPTTFDFKSLNFWNDYYPKVMEASMCCNTTAKGSNLFISSSSLTHCIIIIYVLCHPLFRIFISVNLILPKGT